MGEGGVFGGKDGAESCGSGGPDEVESGEEGPEADEVVIGIDFKGASAAFGEDGEMDTVGGGFKGAAVGEAEGWYDGEVSGGAIEGEEVFFEDGESAPASGAVKFDDDTFAGAGFEFIDAVDIAGQGQYDAGEGDLPGGFDFGEDDFGGQFGEIGSGVQLRVVRYHCSSMR